MTPQQTLLVETALGYLAGDDANPDVGFGMSISDALDLAIGNLRNSAAALGGVVDYVDMGFLEAEIYSRRNPGCLSDEEIQSRKDAQPRLRVQVILEGNGYDGLRTAETFLMMARFLDEGLVSGQYEDDILNVKCEWKMIPLSK